MEIWIVMALALASVVLLVALLLRKPPVPDTGRAELMAANERLERELRREISESSRGLRGELTQTLATFQQGLVQQGQEATRTQNAQADAIAQQLTQTLSAFQQTLMQQAQEATRTQNAQIDAFAQQLALTQKTISDSLRDLSEANARRISEVRATLETQLTAMQQTNAAKLEEMRRTVDEKLHSTLENRLSESFRLVSDRLDKVHQGLGEMQQLAVGVGDLKRVLTNVKTRGTWGEVQLEMLLEQMLTADQFARNVETIPGTGERVEFAIRLPGASDDGPPVWMPIDAKFPKEQYERMLDCAERADADGHDAACRELERALRNEAKTIADKYLSPPLTTDFAILFLPTEGLYAEAMRRPGLADELQRRCRVTIAGPSTLSALLNSLQMGFRTLALEKRSSEVWQVLGAVKTEFGKFGDVLAATKQTLERAARNIEQAETRSRQMSRKLKSVEALPADMARHLLGAEPGEPS